MSEAADQHDAAQHCDRWLDADAVPQDDDGAPGRDADERTRRYVADQQLVDALLRTLGTDDRPANSVRVRRVMDAIRAESPELAFHRRTTRMLSLVGIAACALIAGTLLLLNSARELRASEILAKIAEASLANTDRIYRVYHSSAERDDASEYLGKLYLRGTTGFVVQVDDYAFGRNGNQYWVVPPAGSVIVANDFSWLNSPASREMLELELLKDLSVTSRRTPLVQLSTILKLIEEDYDIHVRAGGPDTGAQLDTLTATRRPADENLPASIRLSFDPETKVVHTVDLTWNIDRGKSLRHNLRFALAPAEPVADDWYQHSAHYSGERAVELVSAPAPGGNLLERNEP